MRRSSWDACIGAETLLSKMSKVWLWDCDDVGGIVLWIV